LNTVAGARAPRRFDSYVLRVDDNQIDRNARDDDDLDAGVQTVPDWRPWDDDFDPLALGAAILLVLGFTLAVVYLLIHLIVWAIG
jgi:hypothetical protein